MRSQTLAAKVLVAAGTLFLMAGCGSHSRAVSDAAAPYQLSIWPESAFKLILAKDGTRFGNIDLIAWGPNWGWMDATDNTPGTSTGGVLDVTNPLTFDASTGKVINLREQASQHDSHSVVFQYSLSSQTDVPLTMITDCFSFPSGVTGTMDVTTVDGKVLQYAIPCPHLNTDPPLVSKITFHVSGVGDLTAAFTPALPVQFEDNSLRVKLANTKFSSGTVNESMSLTFPDMVDFISSKDQLDAHTKVLPDANWYAWAPSNDPAAGEIGMQAWLDGPAGKYGPVTVNGDHFQLGNGSTIKFWGTNLAYWGAAPTKDMADATADRFAKYGINCVRLHKFLNSGWEGIGSPTSSSQFDPTGLDQFDYFTAALKKRGIYYGWSANYRFKVRPGDALQLLDYPSIHANGDDTYGLINGAPDIQDLLIKEVVTLLNHKNPYTGMTYAQDPAMAFLETQNEDDIFFYAFSNIDKFPRYKQALCSRFAAWLKQKYGTQDQLTAAWGSALSTSDNIGSSVDVQTNPWFFTDDGLKGADSFHRQRWLDNALFLHHEQDSFYQKFATAVRAAGYKGPLIGSPWWAPTTLPQYLNLLSDAEMGVIDRHNYYQDANDPVFGTMLSDPGSGDLSSGLLQVADHPFSQSEWCHVWPDVYRAEGPALIAAYGLGLQGWDASYEFQSWATGNYEDNAGHLSNDVWYVDVPSQIGQYPALTRMLYRGDLKEADPIAIKRVSEKALTSGVFDFSDTAKVNGDVKSFTGSVPQEAIAAGKTLVQFTNSGLPSTIPDMSKYDVNKVITSTTGQLVWDYSGKGFFTIDTPETVGVVGFAQNKAITFKAAPVRIQLGSPYAIVLVTAEAKAAKSLGDKALITVLGRETNSGFSYFDLDNHMIGDGGKGPVMEEGVTAQLTFPGRPIAAVNILDQDGRLQPGKSLRVTDANAFAVNTAVDKTIYYEVVFK